MTFTTFLAYGSVDGSEFFPGLSTMTTRYPTTAFCSVEPVEIFGNIEAVCKLPNNLIYPYIYFVLFYFQMLLAATYLVVVIMTVIFIISCRFRLWLLKPYESEHRNTNNIEDYVEHCWILLLIRFQIDAETFERVCFALKSDENKKAE